MQFHRSPDNPLHLVSECGCYRIASTIDPHGNMNCMAKHHDQIIAYRQSEEAAMAFCREDARRQK